MECFKEQYSKAVIRYHDHTAGGRTGLGANRLFDLRPVDITGLWRARQAADLLGIPYPVYTAVSIDRSILNGNWRMPRPTQIHSDECQAAAAKYWQEVRLSRVWVATDPFYLASNYVGHPDQDAYHEFLIGTFKQRQTPMYAIKKAIEEFDAIPASVVQGAMPHAFERYLEISRKK